MTHVYLVGTGPDGAGWLTQEASRVLAGCGLLIGARRLLDAHADHPAQKVEAIDPQAIADAVQAYRGDVPIAVLLSGDSGFYSGARRLRDALRDHRVQALPGICAHQLLCARLLVNWEDAHLMSMHGRDGDVCAAVRTHDKVLLLTGNNRPPEAVCHALCEADMGAVQVTIGQRLGYADECICAGSAKELQGNAFDPLSVMLIESDHAHTPAPITPGLPDNLFMRHGAPMTKQEVRAVSIAKMGLSPRDIVYDIGAGTGSVAIECALLCRQGRVFAIEQHAEACEGIVENQKRFGVQNLRVVHGMAPAALAGLPVPDAVFIGGSGGNMADILALVQEMNPQVRVVINAITLETLQDAHSSLKALAFPSIQITQVSASRARQVGDYHMMTALNPVFILSGGTYADWFSA